MEFYLNDFGLFLKERYTKNHVFISESFSSNDPRIGTTVRNKYLITLFVNYWACRFEYKSSEFVDISHHSNVQIETIRVQFGCSVGSYQMSANTMSNTCKF